MSITPLPTLDDKDLTRIVLAILQLARGRSNAVGGVTLTPSATSTTVSFENCSSESQVILSPRTANAAGALSTTYISAVNNKSFTIAHASAATTDRTFGFVVLG